MENRFTNKKLIFTSLMGNILEFYELTIYGVYTPIISSVFFSCFNDSYLSLLITWSVFAFSFLVRPIGALLFGFIGDLYGRRIALNITIFLMSISTFIIGILPSFESIGIIAPILLILCRLLQGLSAGGEYNGSSIFLLEHASKKRKGFMAGLIGGSSAFGALLATCSGYLTSYFSEIDWFWRVPFLIGSIIGFINFILRRNLSESPEFLTLVESKKIKYKSKLQNKLKIIYTDYLGSSIVTIAFGALNGVLAYTLVGFMISFLSQNIKLQYALSLQINMIGLLSCVLFCPVFGIIFNKIELQKSMLVIIASLITCAHISFFLIQCNSIYLILLSQVFLGVMAAVITGSVHSFVQDLFPTEVRYMGISLNFCIGMGVFGGTTPAILMYLMKNYLYLNIPAYYISFFCLLFLTLILLFKSKKTPVIFKLKERHEANFS
ncbi:MAG: MFS transporter [Flavobacteriales bacterium]|nr:MFS transporter [Flavobacteriales bacterium]